MDTRALLESIQARASKATNVLAAFKEFTRQSNSHNGRVTLEQFHAVCNQNGIRADANTVTDLFKELDLDGDGTIDYKEFVYGVLEGKVPFARNARSPLSDVRAKARREVESNEHTSSMIGTILQVCFNRLSMYLVSCAFVVGPIFGTHTTCRDRPTGRRHDPAQPRVTNAVEVKSNLISPSKCTCSDSASMTDRRARVYFRRSCLAYDNQRIFRICHKDSLRIICCSSVSHSTLCLRDQTSTAFQQLSSSPLTEP